MTTTEYREYRVEEYTVAEEPFYAPLSDEIDIFTAAYQQRLPILLKGPTGVGKTRFVEYMAWKLSQPLSVVQDGTKASVSDNGENAIPLVTVACHEDMTASDLIGRYLLDADGTRWVDGPLTRAVKAGGICYLDEIVEARKDTTVIIHPLTDHRRMLTIDKLGQVVEAADGFLMVVSYNPGYQNALKDLKHSTRQRFVAIEFGYPNAELETEIVVRESGLDENTVALLVKYAAMTRNLKGNGLEEGASTRLLVHAGKLMVSGVDSRIACQGAIVESLTDEPEMLAALNELATSLF